MIETDSPKRWPSWLASHRDAVPDEVTCDERDAVAYRDCRQDRKEDVMVISQDSVVNVLKNTVTRAFQTPPDDWTVLVLRALANLGGPETCIEPNVDVPRRGRGRYPNEYLWDLTISTWPNYNDTPYEYPGYFDSSGQRDNLELLLVAESEWGVQRNAVMNGKAVMEDFAKLLGARSKTKVMVFGYFDRPNRNHEAPCSSFEELTGHMTSLIKATKDNASFVLFGVAWNANEYRGVCVADCIAGEPFAGP